MKVAGCCCCWLDAVGTVSLVYGMNEGTTYGAGFCLSSTPAAAASMSIVIGRRSSSWPGPTSRAAPSPAPPTDGRSRAPRAPCSAPLLVHREATINRQMLSLMSGLLCPRLFLLVVKSHISADRPWSTLTNQIAAVTSLVLMLLIMTVSVTATVTAHLHCSRHSRLIPVGLCGK